MIKYFKYILIIFIYMIILLCGNKRVGKNTIGDYLQNKYNFKQLSFSNYLKQIVNILLDININDDNKDIINKYWNIEPRKLLQYIGTDILRCDINKLNMNFDIEYNNDIFHATYHIKRIHNDIINNINNNIVITDGRFIDEINYIHWLKGKTIKINRNIDNYDNHSSEQNFKLIDNKYYDYIIDNNHDKNELYEKIDNIILKNDIL
jgi:hypothetical protein